MMKLIYDSGPLTLLQHVVALIGASIAFALSLGLASLPFFAFAQQRIAWKFVVGFLIVFELIVCSSVISGWNRMGLIDGLVSVFMVFFPVLLWYRVRREIRNEPISKSDTQVKNTNLM